MIIPKKIARDYHFTDAKAIERLYEVQTSYMHDQGDFFPFHAKFTTIFGDNFLTKIQTAQNAQQDDQTIDILAQKTQDVNDAMTEIRETFYKMRYFLEEAFKEKIHILNEFGYNDYNRVRNSQHEMMDFITTLVKASGKYSVELIAAGYTQAAIDKLTTLKEQLINANDDQEYYKKERKALNQERVMLINEAWAIAQDICRAGKIIYSDNYAKYQQYVLYEGEGGSSGNTHSGNVPPGQTVVILSEGIESGTALTLGNTGQTVLKYCLEDDENPCTVGVDVNPGDEVVTTGGDLGTGTILKVTNLSDTVEGMFLVEVG